MKVYVIAEIGSNFNPESPFTSVEAMVKAAHKAGADAVKMQDWAPIERMDRSDEWKERCGPWTVNLDLLSYAKAAATKRDMGFMTSAFTIQAASRATQMGVMSIKLASSEITNEPLLGVIQTSSFFGTIHMIQRGMQGIAGSRWPSNAIQNVYASLGEVKSPYEVTTLISRLATINIVLMGCVSEYPVKRPLSLLDSITFAQQFGLTVGASSHIAYPDCLRIAKTAVKRGIKVWEAHIRHEDITPDNAPDNGPWALYPDEFAEMVEVIRGAEN